MNWKKIEQRPRETEYPNQSRKYPETADANKISHAHRNDDPVRIFLRGICPDFKAKFDCSAFPPRLRALRSGESRQITSCAAVLRPGRALSTGGRNAAPPAAGRHPDRTGGRTGCTVGLKCAVCAGAAHTGDSIDMQGQIHLRGFAVCGGVKLQLPQRVGQTADQGGFAGGI